MKRGNHPLYSLFDCESFKKTSSKYIFNKCKLKNKIRNPRFQCSNITVFDKIEWFPTTMIMNFYNNKEQVFKTMLNLNYGIIDSKDHDVFKPKHNDMFKKEIDSAFDNNKIKGICGVSCLELPNNKLVYLIGEKHVKHTCDNSYIPAWQFIYNYILSNLKWSYVVDFLLEQDIHEIVKRQNRNFYIQRELDKYDLKKLRYIVSDICKYTKKGIDTENKNLKNSINKHVRIHRNDIRGILYNINVVGDALEILKKQMSEHNVSDDAYEIAKNMVNGLNDFLFVKSLDEFYIKYPWLREITSKFSDEYRRKFDRMIKTEYFSKINMFKRGLTIFDKFEFYVKMTVLLNDMYTIGYIMNDDVHRIVVYAGVYHTMHTEILLIKYFNFRIIWNNHGRYSLEKNDKDNNNDGNNDDEISCCYNKNEVK
ncbi:hypothetical protein [Heterosigma akashiwo virus 01]|uniref:Uncharacterized protein n=1 Tax=Heterosigma akashiwo virus 01 TaxID=97195 RepID=A0A1C9C5A9_HAV01|nr:hypothetical protein D1R72_gp139 [Heterosigma akashiwo virus 01]AOM63470.1 hypothetical protein [Heterosigma akashiwo virus 01]